MKKGRRKEDRASRVAYCQYLLSTPSNYTLTHFGAHSREYSHDQMNRYLQRDRLPPRLVWENVRGQVEQSPNGVLIFDDVVVDKRHAQTMALVRPQWSGNAKAVIDGIGIVTCVYVNPELGQFWVIDYRIYDPECDHKSKLDHMREMVNNAIVYKQLQFSDCGMDTWYAAADEMKYIAGQGKTFYCPLKDNRYVRAADQTGAFCRVDDLIWSAEELRSGKLIHLQGTQDFTVKLFRFDFPTGKRDFIVTNDLTQAWTPSAQQVCGWRNKIEEFHREVKQLTGLGHCQCRLARIIRNHIACAFLVWCRLKHVADQSARTIYQVKHGLLSDYLRRELRHPSVKMCFAA
ncbi:MAG: transposase [Anaerolineae bacterium]|nr:transposase [Anaerolineae bacterium]